jgi:ubiquitin-conjugating enzyme E2 O
LAQNSEHGFCKRTQIFATLKILGTDRVIENVDCNEVEMLSNISEDTVCLLDSWIGYVKEVDYVITLKCSDGSILTINDVDLEDFTDLLTQRPNNDSEFNRDDYYIGQQLYGPKKRLKNAKWISKTEFMKSFMNSSSAHNSKINVVVEDVNVKSVSVNWLCCLSDDTLPKNKSLNSDSNKGSNNVKDISNKSRDSSMNVMSQPNDFVSGEAIKRIKCLNYFRKCSLQIGHQCYYTIKSTDNVIKFSDWEKKESKKLGNDLEIIIENSQTSSLCEETLNSFNKNETLSDSFSDKTNSLIIKDVSTNGSLSSLSSFGSISSKNKKRRKKAKSRFALPLNQIKKKKLRASQRKRPYFLPIDTSSGSRLPVEIVATNTRVCVVWQNGTIEEDIPSIFLYPVHYIDEHDFYPGDFVVENNDNLEFFNYGVVQKSDFLSRIATVKWFKVPHDSETAQFVAQQDVSVYDIKDHPDFSYRSGCCVVRIPKVESDNFQVSSRVGQVMDLTLDGMLECVWADGRTSCVYPQELFVIGDYVSIY